MAKSTYPIDSRVLVTPVDDIPLDDDAEPSDLGVEHAATAEEVEEAFRKAEEEDE